MLLRQGMSVPQINMQDSMKIIYIFLCVAICYNQHSYADTVYTANGQSILHAIPTVMNVQRPSLLSVREEKQQQKELVAKTRQALQEETQAFQDRITQVLNEVKSARRATREGLQYQQEDEAVKKLAILNETYQTLKDIEHMREQLITTIDTYLDAVTKYLDDVAHEGFKKERKLVGNLYYTFDDLLRVYEMIRDTEQRVTNLSEQLKNTQTEHKTRERASVSIMAELKKIQESLSHGPSEEGTIDIDLLRIELGLYEAKKEQAQLQIDESMYRVDLVAFQQFIAKAQLGILKDFLSRIKSSLRINESDVIGTKEGIKKLQQDYFVRKESYRHNIDEIDAQQKIQDAAFETTRKQYNVSVGGDLDDWSREPHQTVDAYVGLCKVGLINSSTFLLKKNKALLDAYIALEDEQFAYQLLQSRVKETYFKIIARRFTSEEQVNQEIKQYETIKATVQASLATNKEKNASIVDTLNIQKKISDNIHALRVSIEAKRATLFRNNLQEHALCLDLLRRAERKVRETTEVLGKLTGIYSGILGEVNTSTRITSFIIAELQSIITIWYRPSYAISWRGFTNIGSDALVFLKELSTYLTRFDMRTFLVRAWESLHMPGVLFALLLKLIVLWALCILAYIIAPVCSRSIVNMAVRWHGFVQFLALFVAFLLCFMRTHFYLVSIGCTLYSIITIHLVPDPYVYVLLSLLAIPYGIFLIYTLIAELRVFNQKHNYMVLSSGLEHRSTTVFASLAYATIVLSVFRNAFMNIYYYQPDLYQSELPTILAAINIILFQASLLILLTKDQMLGIIPTHNAFTAWFHAFVDHYYYLLFCCALVVIIMSHPYVGYSRLVIYVVSGCIYTVLLCKLLLMFHGFLKGAAKYLFFEERDQVVRERFANAKTWFGLSIIASFLFFSSLGVFVGAKIWGWPITVQNALEWLREPLLLKASPHPITVISMLAVFGFIVCGFFVSYALNRFVLDKIFDLLLVDSGVQNMVTRILRYVIVTTALFIALHSVGLGALVTWLIAALGLSLGWVLKDPMADVVAYFIILVQRPIKIGDYIKLNDQTMGIVRKITPRSVVLRRRNSTTIVVPNAQLITHPLENWNYTRNFIAFDDIYVIVQFKENPAHVKEILTQVVHEHPQVLRNPKAIVRLDDLGNRGFVFMVRGYLSSAYTLDQWDIASDVRIAIVQKFRELDIQLALPVMQIVPQESSDLKETMGSGLHIQSRD
jgi:small-conductance mechanosensitive channel